MTDCNKVRGRALRASICMFSLWAVLASAWADRLQLPGSCDDTAWSGTIGSVPVHLAFDIDIPGHELAGRSYYRASVQDLLLVRDTNQPDTWRELDERGRKTGALSLTCTGDALSGTWTSADGKRNLSVSARKIKPSTYSDARIVALRPQVIRATTAGGHAYERLKVPSLDVEGLRLLGDGPALARINAEVMERVKQELRADFDCTPGNRLQVDFQGQDRAQALTWQVLDWNERFIVLAASVDGYCAPAAHPSGGVSRAVYAAASGERVNTRGWLLPEFQNTIGPDSGLGRLLVDAYRAAKHGDQHDLETCLPNLLLDYVEITPSRDGMAVHFEGFAYALMPCEESAVVPYRKLAQFLSAEGRAVMEFYGRR